MSDAIRRADLIAFVAHSARGQMRADKVTPYITHPRRVAALVNLWAFDLGLSGHDLEIAQVAALLHDVLEDTKLTRENLIDLGTSYDALDVIERLTKKNGNEPATLEYYQGISESRIALIVKAADRCSNLEDALAEVTATRELKRWKRYVEKTRTDVLPLYVTLPRLREEITVRLKRISDERVFKALLSMEN